MHQCVRCATLYDEGSNEILKGCKSCGGKFFFFIKKDALKKVQEVTKNLTQEDKKQIEEDVKEIIGLLDEDSSVILDLESVNVLKPGKFELDLVRLFKGDPLVYKLDDGKYIIDVAATFLQGKN
ncbi:MAG: Zn-ribbon containing protein [Candidatus Nanoarchaeia archaeon]